MAIVPLRQIAYARSGDKGSDSNIGVIAYNEAGYAYLLENLTSARVNEYFSKLGVKSTIRYELPNLLALNFILHGVLNGGGSRSLRLDSQGKALGQILLQMPIQIEEKKLKEILLS